MDKEPPSHPPSIRVSTLTHHSVEMAKRCGAWDALGPPWSAAFSAMQVWDAAGRGCIRWGTESLRPHATIRHPFQATALPAHHTALPVPDQRPNAHTRVRQLHHETRQFIAPPASSGEQRCIHKRIAATSARRWDSEDLSLPSMGHVAENHIIQTAFLGVLRKVGVGRVDFGTGIDALQLPSGCLGDAGASQRREPGRKEDPFAVARLSDGRTVRARLVVAADGAQSR